MAAALESGGRLEDVPLLGSPPQPRSLDAQLTGRTKAPRVCDRSHIIGRFFGRGGSDGALVRDKRGARNTRKQRSEIFDRGAQGRLQQLRRKGKVSRAPIQK